MKKPKTCVYCGEPATTVDHIPPKNIFPKELRGCKLITVPSCKACNEGAATDDEEFKLSVSLKTGVIGTGRRALMNDVLKTVGSNGKMYRRIAESERQRIVNPENPEEFWDSYSVPIEGEHIRRTCVRIVKGLHFYLFKEPLAYDAEIKFNLFERLDMRREGPLFDILFERALSGTVGNHGEFAYKVANIHKIHEEALMWRLTFHELFETLLLSGPKGFVPATPPPGYTGD